MENPHLTCIVEWENANALEREAARHFLDGIGKRLIEFGKTSNLSAEILLVFDEDVLESDLREDIASCPSLQGADLPVRLLFTPQAKYYEKKGLAAQHSQAEILLYGDSDCDFVQGWIEALTGPILRDEADMCRGATRAKMEKGTIPITSAIAWFFATPYAGDPLQKKMADRFFANNFAIRRSVIEAVPVPRLDGSRTSGGPWIKRLKGANARVLHVSEAVADHKQYDTFGDLMKRAKLLGADRDVSNAIAGRRRSTRVLRALRSYFAMSFSFLHRFVKVAPQYAKVWQFLPVLFIGLMFQIVAASAQFISAVTANLGDEKESYNELLEIAKVSS
ncbi:hypothetical protein [Yoonia sp. I 8.24]|uniref:hypothetical protein n=1 Tax=Yoonia sp. I 8.24 TaxID=1537229 RepID=UPI001EE04538|nr:hypothetical protein [Yoonia sp. I 8.24]MCG3267597.1 hypothetical protein [Yoonia sp. I 8.24]